MGLPQANLVLCFLSAFVGLWGVSVVFRGSRARRMPGTRRCPECREDMLTTPGRRCPACGFEAETEVELQRRQRDFRVVLVGVVAITAGVALVPAAWWVRGWETTGYGGRLATHPLHAVFWGVVAFGLVLAAWSWRSDRSRGRRRCPRCWYDMRATLAGGDGRAAPGPLICPECGHEPGQERALYRPRRRWRVVWLGLGLVLAGLYGQTVPRALRTGPVGLVPTTVLIGGMRWLPESWYDGTEEGGLDERVNDDRLWAWQNDWALHRARSILQWGGGLDRLGCLLELSPSEPEDGIALLKAALHGVLEDRVDWEETSGSEVARACRFAAWYASFAKDQAAWEEFQETARYHIEQLTARLDDENVDQVIAVFAIVGEASAGSATFEERAFELLTGVDRQIQGAAADYLGQHTLDPDRALEQVLPLLQHDKRYCRWLAHNLSVHFANRTGQESRVADALEHAARLAPADDVTAFMLDSVLLLSPNPAERLRTWISESEFSPVLRLKLIDIRDWSLDSHSLLLWITPIIEQSDPALIEQLLASVGRQPWGSALEREEFLVVLSRLGGHEDRAVAAAATGLRDRILGEEGSPSDEAW